MYATIVAIDVAKVRTHYRTVGYELQKVPRVFILRPLCYLHIHDILRLFAVARCLLQLLRSSGDTANDVRWIRKGKQILKEKTWSDIMQING
nr:unnamed protein product [Callosobruchus analis]